MKTPQARKKMPPRRWIKFWYGDYKIDCLSSKFDAEISPDVYEYLSLKEHENLLKEAEAKARREAFEEAANSVEMLVGEADMYGISSKEVFNKARALREKASHSPEVRDER